ncbi:MAG: hypothetical protein QXF69_09480 [Thermofilaceae archaeon]
MSDEGGYRILLSERVKGISIAQAFEYIDAIQSFKGDWPLHLTPSVALEAERPVELEGITPIPATHGGLAFIEFYVDEDAVASRLASKLKVDPEILRGALERGTPLHRLVPGEALEELSELGRYMKAFLFEASVPIERSLTSEEENAITSLEWITDMDVVEVEVPGVKAELVEAELEKSYYVGEYLRRLEKLFEKAETVSRRLLLVRGEGEAGLKLADLEVMMGHLVRAIPAVRATVMYYRLIAPL